MSFPGQHALDPWRVEQAIDNASFVQGVVIATTRVLRDGSASLTDRDRDALVKCRQLLRCAASSDREGPPKAALGEPRLEPAKAAALVRAARTAGPGPSTSFEDIAGVLDIALGNGELDEQGLEAIDELRDMFLAIGEANLRSITAARNSRRDLGTWMPLTTSSPS